MPGAVNFRISTPGKSVEFSDKPRGKLSVHNVAAETAFVSVDSVIFLHAQFEPISGDRARPRSLAYEHIHKSGFEPDGCHGFGNPGFIIQEERGVHWEVNVVFHHEAVPVWSICNLCQSFQMIEVATDFAISQNSPPRIPPVDRFQFLVSPVYSVNGREAEERLIQTVNLCFHMALSPNGPVQVDVVEFHNAGA